MAMVVFIKSPTIVLPERSSCPSGFPDEWACSERRFRMGVSARWGKNMHRFGLKGLTMQRVEELGMPFFRLTMFHPRPRHGFFRWTEFVQESSDVVCTDVEGAFITVEWFGARSVVTGGCSEPRFRQQSEMSFVDPQFSRDARLVSYG